MKTNTTPQRTVFRAIGLPLLVASLTASPFVHAQKNPPATPAPAADPTAAQPPADAVSPAAPRTGRIPVPVPVEEAGSLPAANPKTIVNPPTSSGDTPPRETTIVNPAAPPVENLLIDPRAKSVIRMEKEANGLTRTIVRTILDEEVSGNPQDTVRNYEAVIAAFDGQRANAAQAIFRLGETYRKLNRLDEARVQYARILREFVDFPDLARLSQKQLSQNPPAVPTGGSGGGDQEGSPRDSAARAAATSAEERKLLLQEIDLLEHQLSETQQLVKTGVAATDAVIPIQREILQLKRQLLRHENSREPAPGPKALRRQ